MYERPAWGVYVPDELSDVVETEEVELMSLNLRRSE